MWLRLYANCVLKAREGISRPPCFRISLRVIAQSRSNQAMVANKDESANWNGRRAVVAEPVARVALVQVVGGGLYRAQLAGVQG